MENKKKTQLITFILIGIVIVGMVIATSIGTKVSLNDTNITLSAFFFKETIEYNDIESIEMKSNVTYGNRTMGTDAIGMKSGSFRNSEFGEYKLCVVTLQKDVIVLKTKSNQYHIFNVKNSDELDNMYTQINDKIQK